MQNSMVKCNKHTNLFALPDQGCLDGQAVNLSFFINILFCRVTAFEDRNMIKFLIMGVSLIY